MCDNICGAFSMRRIYSRRQQAKGTCGVLKEDQRVSEFRSSKKFG